MPDQIRDTSLSDRVAAGRGFLRRQGGVIAASALLVTAGAGVYCAVATPVYTAHARVLVEPLTVPSATQATPDMGTEQAVVTSRAVLVPAAASLNVSVNKVGAATSVTVPVNADVLDIGYSSASRVAARDGAQAVANAYIGYRASSSQQRSATRLGAPALQTHLVSPATRPGSPSSPDVLVDLLAALVVGVIAGSGFAFALDRFGRRVRSAPRWQEVTGLPVLGVLRRDADAARVLSSLRARVVRDLPADGGVLMVAPVGPRTPSHTVASDLASALAASGRRVVHVELASIEDDEAGSGADVGAQDAADPAASCGEVRSRVVLPGRSGAGTTWVGGWREGTTADVLTEVGLHRKNFEVVVLSTPPFPSAVALDAASVADAGLLVDDPRTSRRDKATRAVAELRAAGSTVLGGVLVTPPSAPGQALEPAVPVEPPDESRPPDEPTSDAGPDLGPETPARPRPRRLAPVPPEHLPVEPPGVAVLVVPERSNGRRA